MALYRDISEIENKTEKRQVFIKANFLKIAEIDTKKEEFTADVQLQIKWREPSLDNAADHLDVNLQNYWNPKIVIYNVNPDPYLHITTSVTHNDRGQAFIVEQRRIKGDFAENLELKDFPFDVQDLSLIVASLHSTDAVDIVEDGDELSAVNTDCFVNVTEWNILNLVYSRPSTTKIYTTDHTPHFLNKNPMLTICCVAKRRATYFMYNTVLIMLLITSLMFTTFALSEQQTADRLSRSFIIVLVGVTFMTIANENLPKIPYLTQLNRYIVGSMLINWLVCIWHAVISIWENDPDLQETMDFWAVILLGIMVILFHIFFFLVVLAKRLRRNSTMEKLQNTYKAKAERLNCGPTCERPRQRQNNNGWRRNSKVDAVDADPYTPPDNIIDASLG